MKRHCKVHIWFGIACNILKLSFRVLDKGTISSLVCAFSALPKWRESIHPINYMSLEPVSEHPLPIIGKIHLFVHLLDLPGPIHFGVVENTTLLLHICTPFIDRFFKGEFRIERRFFPVSPARVDIIYKYMQPSD